MATATDDLVADQAQQQQRIAVGRVPKRARAWQRPLPPEAVRQQELQAIDQFMRERQPEGSR